MDVLAKRIIVTILALLSGLFIVFFGVSDSVHNISIDVLNSLYPNSAKLSETIGYTVEMLACVALMITPLAASAGLWFFKIAYDLTSGRSAGVNIFLISPFLNIVMALLFIVLGCYSLYLQYRWAVILSKQLPRKVDDKELARLI